MPIITASTAALALSKRADGTIIIEPDARLGGYDRRLNDSLHRNASQNPDRDFLCQRGPNGEWMRLTYGAASEKARRMASAIAMRDLSPERPVLILSGNSISHALLALACMETGVPYCPVSTAYSLVSRDFGKLRYAVDLLTPGLIFADDGAAYGAALKAVARPGVEVVIERNAEAFPEATLFAKLQGAGASAESAALAAAVGPDTIAKFLLTSGSTGMPKAVPNTQRMLCSNQAMLTLGWPFLTMNPPILVDWLPWNHTFGSNHNFNIVLTHGGTLYIDDGKPTPAGIAETVRNLKDVAPTCYFNVPKGHEALLAHLKADNAFAKHFFSRLEFLFYAGAGLPKPIWDAYRALGREVAGRDIPFYTGLGATETSPSSIMTDGKCDHPSNLGLPMASCAMKLVPNGSKLEVRVKGPHVMTGYWRQPEATQKSFDEEGFYQYGDALRFADPDDAAKGFFFDGRVSEDFKLTSGTWVSAGPLRARVIEHLSPLVRDIAVAGADRDHIAILIFPDFEGCKSALGIAGTAEEIVAHPALRADVAEKLKSLAAVSTGSATRVAAAILMAAPPSIDLGEVTDKGSINQRAVLEHRAGLVEKLYAVPHAPEVILAG